MRGAGIPLFVLWFWRKRKAWKTSEAVCWPIRFRENRGFPKGAKPTFGTRFCVAKSSVLCLPADCRENVYWHLVTIHFWTAGKRSEFCEQEWANFTMVSTRQGGHMTETYPCSKYFRFRKSKAGIVPSKTSITCFLVVGSSMAPDSYWMELVAFSMSQ